MTGEPRPLLALGQPEVGDRIRQAPQNTPRVGTVGSERQSERLAPQFKALLDAFDKDRVSAQDGQPQELDPELVVVFDLAGTVEQFRNAIDEVQGFEFLAEMIDDQQEPDEDFHLTDSDGNRVDRPFLHSLHIAMTNAQAVSALIEMFEEWKANPEVSFPRGLGRFKKAFGFLKAVRRWGAEDRVRTTGLLDQWEETLEVVGGATSSVLVEIELWFRADLTQRALAEQQVFELISAAGGGVRDQSTIPEIRYHALLAELPIQQVQVVVEQGVRAIQLLQADSIMFVSPYEPMRVGPPSESVESNVRGQAEAPTPSSDLPRIALLDGLPFANHDLLANRLTVDDPEEIGEGYPISSRHHGTEMASIIIHGDLSDPGAPLDRPLYVRPILRPDPDIPDYERVPADRLLTDLLHVAVRRIVEGEGERTPSAPSVRIINLSIGIKSRALVRHMSPVGRLLDWLAVEYNLLFVVSAGNHDMKIVIPAGEKSSVEDAKVAALRAARETASLRGVLPPGDAINALTVGSLHSDAWDGEALPDTVWDIVDPGMPALYGATGPGIGRSVKPEIHHHGGRQIYVSPIDTTDGEDFELSGAPTSSTGPGIKVASVGTAGQTNGIAYTHGSSNAAALVTREASQLFDLLESDQADSADGPFPDAQFHPVITKALLVHAASWGSQRELLANALDLSGADARRELTNLLGYGRVDPSRIGTADTSRAVLIAGGRISREARHTYQVPLPISLRSKSEWHRFTVTLASMTPTVGDMSRYRLAKVFFSTIDPNDVGGSRSEAEARAVRRGTCQHEILEGSRALTFEDGDSLPIHVQCMDDARRLPAAQTIRYGLVVSVETRVTTSQTIHDEVRASLQARAQQQERERVRQ